MATKVKYVFPHFAMENRAIFFQLDQSWDHYSFEQMDAATDHEVIKSGSRLTDHHPSSCGS